LIIINYYLITLTQSLPLLLREYAKYFPESEKEILLNATVPSSDKEFGYFVWKKNIIDVNKTTIIVQ